MSWTPPSDSPAAKAAALATPVETSGRAGDDAREDFTAFYAREVAPTLAAREDARQAAVKRYRQIRAGALAAAAVVIAGWFAVTMSPPPGGVWIIGAIAVLGAISFGHSRLNSLAVDVKADLMARLAPYMDVRFSAEVGAPPAFEAFKAHKLLPSHDRRRFEDLIEGERSGCAFQLYEAHLEDERRDKDGDRTYVTVFQGQLLRIAFPQSFLGVTVVLRDAGLLNAFQRPGGDLKRVGLVDPDFEKIFEVYSSDQVEARYLLTPTFMERLVSLETLMHGGKARAAFAGGDLVIAIEGGNLFEAGSMFEPLATPERARRVVKEIGAVNDIIDVLLTDRAQRERTAR